MDATFDSSFISSTGVSSPSPLEAHRRCSDNNSASNNTLYDDNDGFGNNNLHKENSNKTNNEGPTCLRAVSWKGRNASIDHYVKEISESSITNADGTSKIYSEYAAHIRQNGHATLRPVPNIIFSAILWPILVHPSYARTIQFWKIHLPLCLSAVISIILQTTATNYIFVAVMEGMGGKQCGADADLFLRLVCLTVFCCMVWCEIRESYDFARWTLRLPEWYEDDRHILDNELHCGFAIQEKVIEININDRNNNNNSSSKVEFKIKHIAAGGITRKYRLFLIFVGSIIKGSIEIGVLIGGTAYILYSNTNEAVLLNAVSLVFILEIDNYMYKYMTVASDNANFIEHAIPEITLLKGTYEEVGGAQHHYPHTNHHHWFLFFLLHITVATFYTLWCIGVAEREY